MKKLSLKNLKLEASDMLQRSQLKTVFGGYGGYGGYGASTCVAKCNCDGIILVCSGSTCEGQDDYGCTSDTESYFCEPGCA